MTKFSTLAKFAMALLFGGSALAVNAQNVIVEGEAFTPAEGEVYTFTPSMSGTLTIHDNTYPNFNWKPSGTGAILYADADLESPIKCNNYTSDAAETYTDYEYYGIEKGKTYYFMQNQYSSVSFTFTMSETATVQSISNVYPTTDEPLNYVSNFEIQISASAGVQSFGTVTLSYDKTTMTLDRETYAIGLNGPPSSLFIQIAGSEGAAAFKQLLKEVAYSGAENLTITVSDVVSAGVPVSSNTSGQKGVVVNDGTVSITYPIVVAAEYIPLKSYWPTTFYNFWKTDNTDGVAIMQFDQDIVSVDEVNLVMGRIEPGEGGESVFQTYDMMDKVTISRNQLMIDFTGVTRTSTQNTVSVLVQNVRGENGLPVDMSESGTALTLFKYIPYVNEEAPEQGSGVVSLEAAKAAGEIYNLQGVKVNKNQLKPGIYVVDGKKVAVK